MFSMAVRALGFDACTHLPSMSRTGRAAGRSLSVRQGVRSAHKGEMAHSLAEIEDDALRLPPEDRARLAADLLASLEESVESPEQIEKLWLAGAERRFHELRDGIVQGIPAREVFAQLRAKLRS